MTTASDTAFYDRAVRRIYRLILFFGLAGAALIAGFKGPQHGAGFLVGGLASFLNFRWLHQLVSAIGASVGHGKKRRAVLFGLRYLVLGTGGYAILKLFGLDLEAALFGFLVPVAAVLGEILFELAHGA